MAVMLAEMVRTAVAAPLVDAPTSIPGCWLLPGAAGAVCDAADLLTGGGGGFGNPITGVVGRGTGWLIARMGEAMLASTRVNLSAAWFGAQYDVMLGVAAVFTLLFVLLSTVSVVVHRDPARLMRTVAQLPAVGVGSACVVGFTSLVLAVTDRLALHALGGTEADVQETLGVLSSVTSVDHGTPFLVMVFMLLVAALLAFIVWLELTLRSAAIYVSVAFFPLALAATTWEPTRRWAPRLARLLAALALGKVVQAVTIRLAAGSVSDGEGSGQVFAGIALLLLATLAPPAVFKIVGAFDDGQSPTDGLQGRATAHIIYGTNMLAQWGSMLRYRSVRQGAAAAAGGASGGAGLVVAGAAAAARGGIKAAGSGAGAYTDLGSPPWQSSGPTPTEPWAAPVGTPRR